MTDLKTKIAENLTALCLRESQDFSDEYVAEKLGMLPSGVTLLRLREWSLETCFDFLEKVLEYDLLFVFDNDRSGRLEIELNNSLNSLSKKEKSNGDDR